MKMANPRKDHSRSVLSLRFDQLLKKTTYQSSEIRKYRHATFESVLISEIPNIALHVSPLKRKWTLFVREINPNCHYLALGVELLVEARKGSVRECFCVCVCVTVDLVSSVYTNINTKTTCPKLLVIFKLWAENTVQPSRWLWLG